MTRVHNTIVRRVLIGSIFAAAVTMIVWGATQAQSILLERSAQDRLGALPEEEVVTLLTRARQSVAEGDLNAARKHYEAVADLDPTHAEATAYSGWVAFLDGNAAEALERIEASLLDAPFYVDAHLLRGLVLLRGFDDELGAAAEFETVLRLDPEGVLGRSARSLLDEVDVPSPGGGQ